MKQKVIECMFYMFICSASLSLIGLLVLLLSLVAPEIIQSISLILSEITSCAESIPELHTFLFALPILIAFGIVIGFFAWALDSTALENDCNEQGETN